jgi:hypothetical protein
MAMGDQDLISSLSAYAHSRRSILSDSDVTLLQGRRQSIKAKSNETSLLLLQMHAAADYFTTNRTLMDVVPPVLVDIILDPYLLNIFPRSLIPTACYITTIAIVAWFLSAWVSSTLHKTLRQTGPPPVRLIKKKS